MNVGIFVDSFYPVVDGVAKIVDAYASRLAKKCNVTVFTSNMRGASPEYDSRFPYKIVRCKAFFGKTDFYSKPAPFLDIAFYKAIRAANLDIIHVHSAYTVGLTAKWYCRRHLIPLVGTLHSHFRPDIQEAMGKFLAAPLVRLMMSVYNSCVECWAVNESVGMLFLREYGLKRPYRVMPFSTDHQPIKDKEAACREVNERFGFKEDDLVLASVGRLDLQKKEDFVIRSLSLLKKELTNFKMLFIGEGNKRTVLEELSAQLGLNDNIVFPGQISGREEMMKIYARTDLLLFPSVADTYGLVKVEAACQCTPTLFTAGSMPAGGIRDGENGFLAMDDEEAYAHCIAGLLRNPKLLAKVGTGANRDIYNTWDKLVDDVYDNYRILIEKHKFA